MRRTQHIIMVVITALVLTALAATTPAALAATGGAAPTWASDARAEGHKPAPRDLSYLKGVQASPASRAFKGYPVSYDLRALGRVSTPVRDQYPYGTCWAFASLGSLESGLLATSPTMWDFSEDNMVWFAGFGIGEPPYDPYNDGGNSFMALAYLARWGGPVAEADDRYGDGVHPVGVGAQAHLSEAVFVAPRSSSTDNDAIKEAVMTYGGVDVDMYWANGFWRDGTDSYYSTGSPIANHDVVIVGWDDAYSASNFASAPPGPGAFIVRNSWGTGFGQVGYFYVSYYDTTLARGGYNMAFAAAVPADDYNRVYQYDPLGYWPEDGPYVSGSVGWFANEFTAQEADTLAAAGFYTPLPGCTYEIHSGASLAGLALRGAGTIAAAGYHVVPLDTPAPLTAGQDFVVAVKLTMPWSYAYPIPVERPYPGYSTATADPGESFVITDATGWRDLTSIAGFDEANVCLKAFTTGLPAGTFSINDAAAYTRSATATLIAKVTGAVEMRYRDVGGVWSDWEAYASSRTWTLPPGDGLKTVEAEFRNAEGTTALSDSIALDTHRPTTRAPSRASVRRYGYVRLYFEVADSAPCAAKATVTIRIKTLGGVTKKKIELGRRYVNKLQSYRFRCTLAKRTYRYYVYATDAAGNTQRSVGRNYLVVK